MYTYLSKIKAYFRISYMHICYKIEVLNIWLYGTLHYYSMTALINVFKNKTKLTFSDII